MEIQVTEKQYKTFGNCIQISNGIIELMVTIDFGPRIISYSLVGKENVLYEDENKKITIGEIGCKLYGGHRLWISPEIQGRTDYPDNDSVQWKTIENGILLCAPIEEKNGIQKEMEIIIEPNSSNVKVNHMITNKGVWAIEMAPWALTVMAQGGKEVIPQPKRETGLLANRVLAVWPYTKMNDERVYWGDNYITIKQDPNSTRAFKIGINNEEGWVAYFVRDQLFVKRYESNIEGQYTDYGVSYETYTNENIIELETLGELKNVQPGKKIIHIEQWSLFVESEVLTNDEKQIKEILSQYV
jgi:hypothetical protein